ncbi:MAG: hypothetical protein AB3N14_09385 [Flavobacteriaceae bacterium]
MKMYQATLVDDYLPPQFVIDEMKAYLDTTQTNTNTINTPRRSYISSIRIG